MKIFSAGSFYFALSKNKEVCWVHLHSPDLLCSRITSCGKGARKLKIPDISPHSRLPDWPPGALQKRLSRELEDLSDAVLFYYTDNMGHLILFRTGKAEFVRYGSSRLVSQRLTGKIKRIPRDTVRTIAIKRHIH